MNHRRWHWGMHWDCLALAHPSGHVICEGSYPCPVSWVCFWIFAVSPWPCSAPPSSSQASCDNIPVVQYENQSNVQCIRQCCAGLHVFRHWAFLWYSLSGPSQARNSLHAVLNLLFDLSQTSHGCWSIEVMLKNIHTESRRSCPSLLFVSSDEDMPRLLETLKSPRQLQCQRRSQVLMSARQVFPSFSRD